MRNYDAHYIAGRWHPATGATSLPVHEAATAEIIAELPAGSAAEVDLAVAAAVDAFPAWASASPAERAGWLDRLAAGLDARRDEIATCIAREVGMPLKYAQWIQAAGPIQQLREYAGLARHFCFEERVGNSLVTRVPAGVVGAITPWNYPLHQVAAKLGAAFAAGCTVVLKPSEVAPLSAVIVAEVAHEIGLPAGVLNVVFGTGQAVGEPLATHPDVDVVSFTGSLRVGQHLQALAGAQLKRVTLELGGKSASVVLPGADLEKAVRTTIKNCFINSGQTCSALTRLLVPESAYAAVAALAAAAAREFVPTNPLEPGARIGPLASAAQRERVLDYIRRGLDAGAELLCGGLDPLPGPGYFVRPTVFGRVRPEMTIAQEEIFGPVLSILTYHDEADAAAIANGTRYGLSGAVWAADDATAIAFARRLRTGQVEINGGPFNPQAPFGGFKQSGIGRELGKYGLDAYLEYQAFNLPLKS